MGAVLNGGGQTKYTRVLKVFAGRFEGYVIRMEK